MYTVFINDRPIRFVDAYETDQWKGATQSIFVAEQEMTLKDAILELEETKGHPGIIYMAANPGVAWQLFVSGCTLIEAAGGVVMNEKNEYLVIFRKGKYDLPKGKLEYNETPGEGAIREVKEECGIDVVDISKPLKNTFHTYLLKEKRILKKTHWFLMKAASQKPVPQLDEEIESAEWMTESQIRNTFLKNTYASIADLLKSSLGFEIEQNPGV